MYFSDEFHQTPLLSILSSEENYSDFCIISIRIINQLIESFKEEKSFLVIGKSKLEEEVAELKGIRIQLEKDCSEFREKYRRLEV